MFYFNSTLVLIICDLVLMHLLIYFAYRWLSLHVNYIFFHVSDTTFNGMHIQEKQGQYNLLLNVKRNEKKNITALQMKELLPFYQLQS